VSAESFGVDPAFLPVEGTRRKVMSRGVRIVVVVIALNAVLLVMTLVLNPRVEGPAGSSVVTTDLGVGAWRETLELLGTDARQLRVALPDSNLLDSSVAAGSRLVLLNPDQSFIDSSYRDALDGYLRAGGVLISTPDTASELGLGAFSTSLAEDATQRAEPAPGQVVSVTTGLADVGALLVTDRRIEGDVDPLVETGTGQLIAGTRGSVILVSDLAVLANRALGVADNGVLAVRISGNGSVYFDEYVHGFGVGRGLAGVPAATVGLILALLAVLVWMWAIGSRFGPPQQSDRALPPPRAAYLDGIAASLGRAKPTEGGFGVLRNRASGLLARRADQFPGVEPAERRRLAAQAYELSAADLAALDQPVESADQAIHVAAIAAKIEQFRTGSAE